jgi:poly(A) polymerase
MQQTGVLAAVLPGADARCLAPLVHVEQVLGLEPDPVPRLAVLGAPEVLTPLRLSKAQLRTVDRLHADMGSTLCPAALGAVWGETRACQVLALRAAVLGTLPPDDAQAKVAWGAAQQFPLTAADLQPDHEGPALGRRLTQLRAAWLASGLTLSADALRSLPDE